MRKSNVQQARLLSWACALVVLEAVTASHAENYAILFSGGVNNEENWECYYEETYRHYFQVVDDWGYKPENVYVIFADGTNSGHDLTMWVSDPENSDWSNVVARNSQVLEASRANTFEVLDLFRQDLRSGDMFYWWSYDHGGGDKDEPSHHDEEWMSGWGPGQSITDDAFAWRANAINAGRHSYIFGQCYSGGMLEELDITPGSNKFGCASCDHDEPSQSGEGIEGWNHTWADGIAIEGYTYTHDLYAYALDCTDFAYSEGPNVPYVSGYQHPWKIGDDLFMPMCEWKGSGSGGSSTDWYAASNWTYTPSGTRSARVEFAAAGSVVVNQTVIAGYLTVESDATVGIDGKLRVIAGGVLNCRTLDIGKAGVEVGYDEYPTHGYVRQEGGTVNVEDYLILGDRRLSTGQYDMWSGNLNVQGTEMVIGNGAGTGYLDFANGSFNQLGGVVNLASNDVPLYVGKESHGIGTYTLAGQLWGHEVFIGYKGTGTMTQVGGRNDIETDLWIGYRGDGTYNMQGGVLTADTIMMAYASGPGATFTMTGGTVEVDNMTMAFETAGATVTMSGGTLTVAETLEVGVLRTAEFQQSDGVVSTNKTSVGDHTLSLDVGTYRQTGGTHEIATDLLVGKSAETYAGAEGEYELGGTGELIVHGNSHFGYYGKGDFVQNGGSHVVDGNLILGGFATGVGTYDMTGGTVSALAVFVGHRGSGEFTGSGGTKTVRSNLYVGYSPDSDGTYSCGGSLDVQSSVYVGYDGSGTFSFGGVMNSHDNVYVGYRCVGTFEQYGDHNVTGDLHVAKYAGSEGSYYTIIGGTLDAPESLIQIGNGGTFTFESDNSEDAVVICDEFELQGGATFTANGFRSVLRVNKLTGFGFDPYFDCSLELGHSGGRGSAGYDIAANYDDLTVTKNLVISCDAPATFTQGENWSDVTVGALYVGAQGTYTLDSSGGKLEATRESINGAFTHVRGSNILVGEGDTEARLAVLAGGTYDLSSTGYLSAREEAISGTFSQTGGTNIVTEEMVVDPGGTGQGTYDLSEGLFNGATVIVGTSGAAVFEQSGGSVTLTDTLYVCKQSAGGSDARGTYNLSSGRLTSETIEIGYAGTGTLTQSGAAQASCGMLRIAYPFNAELGTYNLNGGTLSADEEIIGPVADGRFNQTAGNHTIEGDLKLGGEESVFENGVGTYDMTGGTLDASTIRVGYTNTGNFYQNGSSAVSAGSLMLGSDTYEYHDDFIDYTRSGVGTYVMHNGTLTAASQCVGNKGTGTFTQHGGTNNADNVVRVGYEAGSIGTYNLNGGGLTSHLINVGHFGVGTFNYNGGTLNANYINITTLGTMNVRTDWTADRSVQVNGGTLNAPVNHVTFNGPSDNMAQLTLNSGAVLVYELTIGGEGAAMFTWNGGTLAAKTINVVGADSFMSVNRDWPMHRMTLNLMSGGVSLGENAMYVGVAAMVMTGPSVINQTGGSMTSGEMVVGHSAGGIVAHSGGTNTVWGMLTIGQSTRTGYYTLSDSATLDTDTQYLGPNALGTFTQTGGTNTTNAVQIGSTTNAAGEGVYAISGGSLDTQDLLVGTGPGVGRFQINGPDATINITHLMRIGDNGHLSAVAGATVSMRGSAFVNESVHGERLAGLSNMSMVVSGYTPFEVAGEDLGATLDGCVDNFALGELRLTDAIETAVQLVNDFDNNPRGFPGDDDADAMYVHRLCADAGSYIDLNGLTLYYMSSVIDPDARINVNGGALIPIEIPDVDAEVVGHPVDVTISQDSTVDKGTYGMISGGPDGQGVALSCTAEIDPEDLAEALRGPRGRYVTFRMFYDESELDLLGVAEDTLRPYWWDEAAETWILGGTTTDGRVGESVFAGTGSTADDHGVGYCGLDLAGNFMWVNLNHASAYGAGGLPPAPATLTWDGADPAEWTSAHWDPGSVVPAGGDAMVVDSGTVTVSTDLTGTQAASLAIAAGAAGGTVNVGPAGRLRITGHVNVGAGGTLGIDGAVTATTVNVAGGTLTNSPSSANPVTVNGDVMLGDGATFAVDAIGAGLDNLAATGDASIGPNASLEIRFCGGGNEFQAGTRLLIEAAGVSGRFAHVTDLNAYTTGDGLTYDDEAGTVTLTLDLNLNPGDGNLDGATDVSDRIIWNTNNFTAGTTFITGDFNGDGVTDVSDRIIWNTNNFTFATAGAAPIVPEPATMCLMSLGLLMTLRRFRKRK